VVISRGRVLWLFRYLEWEHRLVFISSLLEAKLYKLKLPALWKSKKMQNANFIAVLVFG